jgi:hypothetical protein
MTSGISGDLCDASGVAADGPGEVRWSVASLTTTGYLM